MSEAAKILLLQILFPQTREYNSIKLYHLELISNIRKLSDQERHIIFDDIKFLNIYINNREQYCILIGNKSEITRQFNKIARKEGLGADLMLINPIPDLLKF